MVATKKKPLEHTYPSRLRTRISQREEDSPLDHETPPKVLQLGGLFFTNIQQTTSRLLGSFLAFNFMDFTDF